MVRQKFWPFQRSLRHALTKNTSLRDHPDALKIKVIAWNGVRRHLVSPGFVGPQHFLGQLRYYMNDMREDVL